MLFGKFREGMLIEYKSRNSFRHGASRRRASFLSHGLLPKHKN